MNSKLTALFILIFSCISNVSISQINSDTILFFNGKTLITTVTNITKPTKIQEGTISHTKKRNTDKIKIISSDDVFSIKRSTGEKMIYFYDTAFGNEFTVEEMRLYMLGHLDASQLKNGYLAFTVNMILSVGVGATGTFLAPVIPFMVAGLFGLPKVKVKNKYVSNPDYLKHDPYLMGYEHEGKRKRKLKSLLGGGIGLIAGLIAADILKKNGNELLK